MDGDTLLDCCKCDEFSVFQLIIVSVSSWYFCATSDSTMSFVVSLVVSASLPDAILKFHLLGKIQKVANLEDKFDIGRFRAPKERLAS